MVGDFAGVGAGAVTTGGEDGFSGAVGRASATVTFCEGYVLKGLGPWDGPASFRPITMSGEAEGVCFTGVGDGFTMGVGATTEALGWAG